MGTLSYLVGTVEMTNPLTVETNSKDSSGKWGNQFGYTLFLHALFLFYYSVF